MAAFRPASELAKDVGIVVKGRSCRGCGDPAEDLCEACLTCTIESVVERMARDGALDDAIRRVIERARG